MLDFPTAPSVANADRRRQIETLAREFWGRAQAGARDVVACLAPDFAYRARGAWPMWPYHAGPINRTQFVEALIRNVTEFEVLRTDIHEFLIGGEAAAIHATFAMRSRGAGAPTDCDCWICLRFRDDLIVEAAIYLDVAQAAKLLPAGLFEVHPHYSGGGGERPANLPAPQSPDGFGPGEAAASRHLMWMEQRVHELFALRAKGDFEAMLAQYAPDFVYVPCGSWTRLPLMADRCDRATFAELLRLVIIEFEDLGGPIHELVVDGDRVAVHRTMRLRNRGTGGLAEVDEWVYLRIRDGLFVEMASYVDNLRAAKVAWPPYTPPR